MAWFGWERRYVSRHRCRTPGRHSQSTFTVKIAATLLVILNAALLVPAATPYLPYIVIASLFIAIVVLALAIATAPLPEPPPVAVAEAVKPAPVPEAPTTAPHAEAVILLGVLQEKGRFIDFLMEDLTPYNDADVGSVARTVHQGCKAAMNEHFQIEPVRPEGEGASLTLPAGYPADEIRLSGNLSGAAPFTGTIVHKGWKTKSVKLPRVLHAEHLPVIAPAQVEVK
jgi:hypothetical protein